MIGCLRNSTIAWIAEGGGTARQRRHLARCVHCATRHAAVIHARDLAAVVLRGAMLRTIGERAGAGRAGRGVVRWLAPFAAAASLALVLFAARSAIRARDHLAAVDTTEAQAYSLDDLSRSVFAADDTSTWLEADADEAGWEMALSGEQPCETQTGASDPRCD